MTVRQMCTLEELATASARAKLNVLQILAATAQLVTGAHTANCGLTPGAMHLSSTAITIILIRIYTSSVRPSDPPPPLLVLRHTAATPPPPPTCLLMYVTVRVPESDPALEAELALS